MNNYVGRFDGRDFRVAVIASRFNESVTKRLMEGAVDALLRQGVPDEAITTIWVPGAFELPAMARRAAVTGHYDAIVTVGAVIRGESAHFEYVAGHALNGLGRLSMEVDIPITCGVLTTEDVAQAEARAGGKHGNKGAEAALAALEMADLYARMPKPQDHTGTSDA